MNAIHVIQPRWESGSLVFDDPDRGLLREPFVAGADTALGILAAAVPGCEETFTLVFSAGDFPGSQACMKFTAHGYGGAYYVFEDIGMTGWLCPALYKYFNTAPKRIYLQVKEVKK